MRLDAYFDRKPEELRRLGNKTWELRKWILDHPDILISQVPKGKREQLEELRKLYENKLPDANSVEYNFGTTVSAHAINCFRKAKSVESIDKIFDECRGSTSINDSILVNAYLELNEIEKAEGVVNHLLGLNEPWAKSRAIEDSKCIENYKTQKRQEDSISEFYKNIFVGGGQRE